MKKTKKSYLPPALQKKKNDLQKQLNEIHLTEQAEFINKNYDEIIKRYLGKFFKSKNGYNAKHQWDSYLKVIKITPDNVYVIGDGNPSALCTVVQYDITSDKEVIIKESITYLHLLETEITQSEFYAAVLRTMKAIRSLEKMPVTKAVKLPLNNK